LGVGLAAPQVGQNIALAIIEIQPTEHRPDVDPFDLVIINPEITETYGYRQQLWEGCISAGSNGKADLFAKVPRYKKVKLRYLDEKGKQHEKIFEGLPAQVVQHEVDHLNGILFVDRVKDTSTYMTYSEYKKLQKMSRKNNTRQI
jgi:peptide deformylase